MRFVNLLEIVVVLVLIYTIITQVLIPAFRGTAMFPMFRRESKLKAEIIDQNQKQYEAELADAKEQRRREWYGTTTKEETDAAEAAARALDRNNSEQQKEVK